jgi:hypothetical protein
MNLIRAFAAYMEASGVATYDKDLFISRAPSSNTFDQDGDEIPQNIWWLKAAGGSQPANPNFRGQLGTSTIEVYYRDRDPEIVYDKLTELAADLSCNGCLALDGFEVVGVTTTGPFVDQDVDAENRMVGLLQVNITTYMKGC